MQDFKWDVTKPRRVLIDFLKEEGIQYLDLLPAFKDCADRTGEYFHYPYDGHWNVAGHRLVGEEMYKWLKKQIL